MPKPGAAPAQTAAAAPLYRESWAVVIGIDKYQHWPALSYAVNDAQAVRDVLIRRYGFKPDHVITLFDEEATRDRILAAIGDRITDATRVQKDDRVFVFFAGHGTTRRLPSGKALGYLVPVDADLENYQSQAISMSNFQDIADAIPARHLLLVTDACYSGLALTRGGPRQYLREVTGAHRPPGAHRRRRGRSGRRRRAERPLDLHLDAAAGARRQGRSQRRRVHHRVRAGLVRRSARLVAVAPDAGLRQPARQRRRRVRVRAQAADRVPQLALDRARRRGDPLERRAGQAARGRGRQAGAQRAG